MRPILDAPSQGLVHSAREAGTRRNLILIVDDDFAFLWWLGEALARAGLPALPALNCRQAASQIKKLKGRVDVVILNPTLAGSQSLLETLEAKSSSLKTILLSEPAADHSDPTHASSVLKKPGFGDSSSLEDWRRKLHQVLADTASSEQPHTLTH